jgi:hypothetical protein
MSFILATQAGQKRIILYQLAYTQPNPRRDKIGANNKIEASAL